MRKLAYGLTGIALALSPSGCTVPESSPPRATSSASAEQTPSPWPTSLVLNCGFHSYSLEAGGSREQACQVAQNIGSAIFGGKEVAIANNYVWFDKR